MDVVNLKSLSKIITSLNMAILESRDSAEVRVLASHQCGSGLIMAGYHMQVEFVIGSCLALRVFLQVLRFSFLHKNQHLQIPIRPG